VAYEKEKERKKARVLKQYKKQGLPLPSEVELQTLASGEKLEDTEHAPQVKMKEEFSIDEVAWKKVRGDVFRRPKRPFIFSVLVGTGVQVTLIVVFTLLLACLGFMQPNKRGIILKSFYLLLILTSFVGGYVSARFYKMFLGTDWLFQAVIQAIAFPGFILG